MARLLTAYEAEKEVVKPRKIKKAREATPPASPLIPEPILEYRLFYPDNSASGYHNGKIVLNIEGEEIPLEIINGVVLTTNPRAKTELVRRGYVFMYEKPVEV